MEEISVLVVHGLELDYIILDGILFISPEYARQLAEEND
jgi:hypothetical protein